jgi:hypothetical protein
LEAKMALAAVIREFDFSVKMKIQLKLKLNLVWNFDFSVNNSLSKHKKMNHLIIKSKKAVTA